MSTGASLREMSGTVVLSLEIELGWGLQQLRGDEGYDRFSPERQRETEMLERLLALCDRLELPISFDVVGHLLLDQCRGDHEGPHAADWFDSDPGTDVDTDPLFYAPDLIRRVRDADTPHELCTHTFSHALSDESEAILGWELQTATECHREFDLAPPRSFVPPMHAPPPRETLARHGLSVVRLPTSYEPPVGDPTPPSGLRRRLPWTVRRLYPVQVLARSHPVEEPQLVDGVVETYTSWHASLTAPYLPNGQAAPHPVFRLLPTALRQRIHERYLRAGLQTAIERESHAHFWSHLFNLANESQWLPVKSFLETLATRRDRGDVEVVTMEALGDRVRNTSA